MKFLRSTFLTALLALIGGAVYAGCTARATYTQNGNTVIFYNDSSTSISGNHTLRWNFGDGTTGYGDQVVHRYAPGTYRACLTIYDSTSCMDSTCLTITVSNSGGGCAARAGYSQNGSIIMFSDYNSSSNNGHTFKWSFGDGNTGLGPQISHKYQQPGTYTACLTIHDSIANCTDSTCLSVTISNNNGGNNCNASFSYGVDSANSLKYFFSGSAPGAGLTPHWIIYDANTKNYTGQNIVHTFSGSGTYNVTYSLIDSIGDTCDFVTKTVTVNNNGGGNSCKASFYVALDSNNKFNLYLVNNSTGTTPNTRYSWNFGDGTTSNAQYPTHQYANFGLYTICLTIMNGNVCTSTYCDSVGLDSNGNILKTSGFGITVIDEAMLGVEEPSMFTGVNVYPNPSSGKFTFAIDSKKGANMIMRVMNSMGQEVALNETYLTVGSNKTQLDLSSLSDGLYFVNLRAGDEVKNVRLYLAR